MPIPEECKEGGFFQFPLCLLAQPISFRELLERSFHYGVCHYLDIREENEEEPPDWDIPWRGSAADRKTAFEHAREKIRFRGGDLNVMIQNHAIVAKTEDAWRQQGRKTAQVRLRTDIHLDTLKDTLNQSALSERDWRTLCAVYSAIGDKPFVEIGWKRIAWRAAGWLSPINGQTKPCGPLYPRGQINRSLAMLVARKFVRVAPYRRGQRFWSNRFTHEQLWTAVVAMKTKCAKEAAERKRLDQQQSFLIHAILNPGTPTPHPALIKSVGSRAAARV